MPADILYTPTDFVAIFNQSIDNAFGSVLIEGEISSFQIRKNKWVYFDLKDDLATLRCFGTVYMLPGPLEDGMMVRIQAFPRLHPQFNFSLNVQSITAVGEGAIAKQAELLRQKLEKEGIFELSRKRKLPYPPESIALVTSLESAAYADFVKITTARWPFLHIDVVDVLVQGISAPEQIASAMEYINKNRRNYEVVVIIRGGGSAEDLSVFSDERVVRAISGSRTPTLVAIGHEVDESLAELVADLRASTPSNAAELLVPDLSSEQLYIDSATASLLRSLNDSMKYVEQELKDFQDKIIHKLEVIIGSCQTDLQLTVQRLQYLNPKEVLMRGYALIKLGGQIVSKSSSLRKGDKIDIILSDGERAAVINE